MLLQVNAKQKKCRKNRSIAHWPMWNRWTFSNETRKKNRIELVCFHRNFKRSRQKWLKFTRNFNYIDSQQQNIHRANIFFLEKTYWCYILFVCTKMYVLIDTKRKENTIHSNIHLKIDFSHFFFVLSVSLLRRTVFFQKPFRQYCYYEANFEF